MPFVQSRSRRRNKSRGKSRHRSTHSTRPPSAAPSSRIHRTTSIPPKLNPNVNVKSKKEIEEDHEYVRKVLEYLEKPEEIKENKKGITQYQTKTYCGAETGAISKTKPPLPDKSTPKKKRGKSKVREDIPQLDSADMSNITKLNSLLSAIVDDSSSTKVEDLLESLSVTEKPVEKVSKAPVKSPMKEGIKSNPKELPEVSKEAPTSLNNAEQLTREEVMAQRKAKKESKQAKKSGIVSSENKENNIPSEATPPVAKNTSEKPAEAPKSEKSKADLKKERRAIQDAQREAKEKALKDGSKDKKAPAVAPPKTQKISPSSSVVSRKPRISKTAKNKHMEGMCTVPGLQHLADPNVGPKPFRNYHMITPEFESLCLKLQNNHYKSTDGQCVELIICLHTSLNDWWCSEEENENFIRDLLENIEYNVSYLKSHNVFIPPMKNIMKVFTEKVYGALKVFEDSINKVILFNKVPRIKYDPKEETEDGNQSSVSEVELTTEEEEEENVEPATPLDFKIRRLLPDEEHDPDLVFPKIDPYKRALWHFVSTIGKWLINLNRKVYITGAVKVLLRLKRSFRDGSIILVYGYHSLFVRAVKEFCEEGMRLSIIIADHFMGTQKKLMMKALKDINLNGGILRVIQLGDVNEVIPMVDRVYIPIDYVNRDGMSQCSLGASIVSAAAKNKSNLRSPLNVYGITFGFHFTDFEEGEADFPANIMGFPEDLMFGRNPSSEKYARVKRFGPKIPRSAVLCVSSSKKEAPSKGSVVQSLIHDMHHKPISSLAISLRVQNGKVKKTKENLSSTYIQSRLIDGIFSSSGKNSYSFNKYLNRNCHYYCTKYSMAEGKTIDRVFAETSFLPAPSQTAGVVESFKKIM